MFEARQEKGDVEQSCCWARSGRAAPLRSCPLRWGAAGCRSLLLEPYTCTSHSCRSLLRFLSYTTQVTGQFLIYMGSYMLRLLGETEEPLARKAHSRGRFNCG